MIQLFLKRGPIKWPRLMLLVSMVVLTFVIECVILIVRVWAGSDSGAVSDILTIRRCDEIDNYIRIRLSPEMLS